MYDPDASGVLGHQPSNFDRLALNYDRYVVLGSRIKILEINTSTTSVTQGALAIHLSEDGLGVTTAHAAGGIDNVMEQPDIARQTRTLGLTNVGKPFVLSKTFSAKKYFGVPTSTLKGHPYSADVTADPTEQAFFEIAYMSPDNTNNPGLVTLRAEIEYVALLTEPKLADAS